MKYAIRLPANDNLERDIGELLTRPRGKAQPQAGGLVQESLLPGGQLEDSAAGGGESGASSGRAVPASGIHRDQLETDSRAVVRFYNKRGTAEQWIKEGKQAVKMTGTALTVSEMAGALQEKKLLPTAPPEAHWCTLLLARRPKSEISGHMSCLAEGENV